MSLRVTDAALEVLPADAHRTDEWYARRQSTVTASEIAAVLGLSPYYSPFDLWWQKKTGVDSQPDSRDTRRGRRYERLILEDFTDEHPEFAVVPRGLCVNVERPWQACSPDGLVHELIGHRDVEGERTPVVEGEPVAVVEAKSAARRDEWGEQGTDDIPVYYRTQVLWQMDTLGLGVAYVPVIFGFDYCEYVVTMDEAAQGDVKVMRDAAREFLDSIAADIPPDIDAHTATGRRLKLLHASLVDGDVEVEATVVRQYHLAKRLRDCAEARMRLAENRLRACMGDYQRGTVDGRKVVSRSVSDIKERRQTVKAHTRNVMHFTKPKPQED